MNARLGFLLHLQQCVCVSVRVHFACDCAFASLPVVIRVCIVVCVYFVRKPTGLVHTPKHVKESPVKSDSNGDCRWSKVVAAFWDALATPHAATLMSAQNHRPDIEMV